MHSSCPSNFATGRYSTSRVQRAPYTAKAIANYFLAKQCLTQMKLHKLVYYAQGWHLGITGQPLLDETLEAWQYGPVVPSIYREFRSFGASPITCLAMELNWRTRTYFEPQVDPSDRVVNELLDSVRNLYGKYTAAQLSELTHRPDSPWSATRRANPGLRCAGIANEVIRSHFAGRLESSSDGE